MQTKPKGTSTQDTSSFKKLRPPTKLVHALETMGMVMHPAAGSPVQAVMVGATSFVNDENNQELYD